MAEYHHDGNPDWVQGSQFGFRRSLQNPRIFTSACSNLAEPDTYRGAGWIFNANCDRGGVHTNCGPQNKWFYLLSEGGFLNGVDVFGLGIEKAADITFYNLTHFMQGASQYADARSGAIAAAKILYRHCSGEVRETTNAWAAVGVGATSALCEFELHGPTHIFICEGGPAPGGGGTYKATGSTGTSYTWSVNAGWTFHTQGPGNNTLVVTNIPPPPPPLPTTVIISATSSNGVTKTLSVQLDDCHGVNFCNKIDSPSAKRVENKQEQFFLYPNPAHDLLTVEYPEGSRHLQIIDLSGKLVQEKAILEEHKTTLVLDNIESGLYFVRIQADGEYHNLKFIKTE